MRCDGALVSASQWLHHADLGGRFRRHIATIPASVTNGPVSNTGA
jgi:hypothetical protein